MTTVLYGCYHIRIYKLQSYSFGYVGIESQFLQLLMIVKKTHFVFHILLVTRRLACRAVRVVTSSSSSSSRVVVATLRVAVAVALVPPEGRR